MSEKLLPCPSCGGEASVRVSCRVMARCLKCGVQGQSFSMVDVGVEAASNQAIAAWNRRTPAPEGEGKRLMLVDLDGAPFGSEFLDNLNGYATGGSGRCLDILTVWGATLYASPVVPVGVRERVLDELDKAWLHGQRRTSWRRDESADAIIAALRFTDTGREA